MNNFLICKDLTPEYFGWITLSGIPSMLFYSYIPAIILILIITFFIYKNNKNEHNHTVFYLSFLSLSATLWMLTTLVQWLSAPVVINIFAWSIIGLFEMFVYIFSLCFFISFVIKRDITLNYKIILGLILLPILLFENFHNIINYFDIDECNGYYNLFYTTYIYTFEILSSLFVIFWGIWRAKKTKVLDDKKQIIFITVAVFLFQILFTLSSVIGEATLVYGVNLFGPIGLVVFVSVLSFLIVRFKAFDIKLIGAQALVWALVILIGSQFLYMSQMPVSLLIITGATLIIASVVGMTIVRGVKREISLRESLEISNKGQENLIHIMNHQIKGFLGTARNIFAEFLTPDQSSIYGPLPELPEEATSALRVGLRTTTDGVRYVTDILRGSSASKGSLELDLKPMDTKVIVEELIVELQPLAKEWNVVLEGTVAPSEYKIIGDHTQLKEVFKNLITNAIRHNDPDYKHKSAKVSLSRKGNKILFAVRDTGNGIAPEDRARMFTPGGMGQDALKHDVNSTGFGLSFVKSCVLSHNGIVDYKSNAPEKGTTFFVELPADLSK